ncbi:MAG TPA: Gfo/Idh/MocA family oxidoreductase [Polyangiaceae bacterium]|nr:Gfo/Idh/MocA family oxidoreductase [Polyangiaceae bacterium]
MLKGGVVGYGFIAENGHMPAYEAARQGGAPLEIVAVADVSPERRARVLVKHPKLRVYSSHQEMLERERELSFVDIATPPSEHAEIALDAFGHGLHVFCEKPMAVNTREAASMMAAAERAGRVLFPSHNYKHAPVVRAVRRAIDDGLVGRVHLVTLQTFRPTHAKGVPEFRPDWRRERRYSGGGIAMDHGSHTFYLAFEWLAGFPTSVTAKVSTLGAWDTEDDVSCTLTFPHGVASAHLTWNAGVRKVIYSIHGTNGAVRVEDDDVEVSTMVRDASGKTTWDVRKESISSDWMDASHVKWFKTVFDRFVSAMDRKEWVGRDAIESFRAVELIEGVYESARRGSREVRLGASARRNGEARELTAG